MKNDYFYFVKSFNRYTKEYEIDALGIYYNNNNTITCYSHIGQHCTATRDFGINRHAAAPFEYMPLLNELKSIGYNPSPLTRTEWMRETSPKNNK